MAKIKYQTDGWGGKDGNLHFELEIDGKPATITIKDNNIHINSAFLKIDHHSVNACDIEIVEYEEIKAL